MRMKSIAPLAVALAVGAMGLPQSAWSQTPQVQNQQPQEQRQVRPSRIEGRIAFLRAELKITDAQAPLFDAIANVMRENDRAMRIAFEGRRQRTQPASLLDRLDQRQKRAEDMASATSKLKAAWAPLYAALSDEQKKTADELFSHHGGHRIGHRRI
ncbi:MAG TPA: Spy/CpxP family protein refolding chaperone [Alphaproteobacteria bacterium]|nr:Spy/CpxP family protein refolding chaperone [Alphaproteobacteria bacterium]